MVICFLKKERFLMGKANVPLRDFAAKLKSNGIKCTFLGVGPVSEIVIRATIEACRRYDCPPIFIASRNQVDLKELGHGYLMGGMDQQAFVSLIEKMRVEVGYEGPVYICRDHGGPWQRNVELDSKYPVDKAMEIARQSFRADIEAGFNYLHIDPTKCPHSSGLEDICHRTVELTKFCEETRKSLNKEPIDYEVGTEDIEGGLTERDKFEAFLRQLAALRETVSELKGERLPLPTCVVAQTGTLTRMHQNVGDFDQWQTKELVETAAKYEIGLKEHNGDYLSAAACRVHPDLGIMGVNVAPEFGLVETDACLYLAHLEQKLVREGFLKLEDASHLHELFVDRTFTHSPWEKWMTDEMKQCTQMKIESDSGLRLLIARVCGHYVYNMPEVLEARKKLYKNIDENDLVNDIEIENPDETKSERFVINRVRSSIEFYLKHFRCKGINQHYQR